jgi:hypothetical protein
VISGIVHFLESGSRRVDFVRWAEKGVWTNVFQALAQAGGPSALYAVRSLSC